MIKLPSCPICVGEATPHKTPRDSEIWECPACGTYEITRTASVDNRNLENSIRQRISGWLNEQQDQGTRPFLRSFDIERLASIRIPSLPDRANLLLRRAIRIAEHPFGRIDLADRRLWGVSYSIDASDVTLLSAILIDQGFFRDINDPGYVRITPKGHVESEQQTLSAPNSSQGFVAMWFNEATNVAFQDGLRPAIELAGYTPLRIDSKEHTNKIDDEIVAEIRRSRFLVADFTGHRGGVYFEAGFAMGLNIPVFFTCRQDQINDLHFDIRQYNTIAWTNEADLKTRLKNRIIAVIGEGPKARN